MGAYDHALKAVVDADPAAIARWVIRVARQQGVSLPDEAIASITQASTEFQGTEAEADGLLLIRTVTGTRYFIHLEFQSKRDPTMPDRLLDYCLRIRHKHGYLPIVCCVIYLREGGTIEEPPGCWYWPDGQVSMAFQYLCVKVWEVPREEILVEQQPALLPLALLAKGEVNRIIVRDTFAQLHANQLDDLLFPTQIIAGWLLSKEALEWLRGEYYRMLDFFEDSPVYEWVAEREAEKARQRIEEERQRTLEERQRALARFREVVVALVAREFPDLEPLATKQVALIEDQDRLQQLILQVSLIHEMGEMVQVLAGLGEK